MEFDCRVATFLRGFVSELNLEVLDLTLPAEGVVEDLNIRGAVCRNLGHFQFLEILKLAYHREYHSVHDSVYILIFKLESKI